MNASDKPTRERTERDGGRSRRDDAGERPEIATRATFTVALAVTFAFLLVTAAGLGWFLSDDGPASELTSTEASDEDASPTAPEGGDDSPAPEGTVADPGSGLSYELPGEGWQRLGDDEVPQGYSSYAVHGSVDDPDALIVTGAESLGAVEPLGVTAARLATDSLSEVVTDGDIPEVEAIGESEIDDHPAFEASVSTDEEEETYGRFLLVELADDHGAFVLGLHTGGDEMVSADIDAALDSVGAL